MLWMLVGMSWGMDGLVVQAGGSVARGEPSVTPYGAVEAALAPFDATLKEALASDGWFSVEGATLQAMDASPLVIAAPLLVKDPTLRRSNKAVAAKSGDRWTSQALSNAKAVRNPDGTLAAVAFGMQSREEGRGVYVESRDVLVTYDHGRPTHVFSSTTPDWGGWSERTLLTLETSPTGTITGAREQRARSDQEWLADRDEPVLAKTATTAVWSTR